jgi:hypothetical protein
LPPPLELTPEDKTIVEKIARTIARRRLVTPAIMVLETGRPLNYVASQFLTFLHPFATAILNTAEYERFVHILEHREGVDVLVDALTRAEDAVRDGATGSPPGATG